MKNKKASLKLFIKTILIVVVVSCLGLICLNYYFNNIYWSHSAQSSLVVVMKGTDLDKIVNPPSKENPLTITPSLINLYNYTVLSQTMITKKGRMGISFLNNDINNNAFTLKIKDGDIDCIPNNLCNNIVYTYTNTPVILKQNEIAHWTLLIEAKVPIASSQTEMISIEVSNSDESIIEKANVTVIVNP